VAWGTDHSDTSSRADTQPGVHGRTSGRAMRGRKARSGLRLPERSGSARVVTPIGAACRGSPGHAAPFFFLRPAA
jgi:hypothetical protein